ncbi:MAG: M48 family metalloprotease [Panacagrimonas sp.]
MRRQCALAIATASFVACVVAATATPEPAAAGTLADASPRPQRELNLPQIGDPADTALSPAQEAKLGARVVSQFYAYDYLLEDPQLVDYLTAMGWRLAAASGTRPSHLEFFVVKDSRINAFALPGGYMGFNAGIVTASSSESELAGVMGHELAHVTQRHIARAAADTGGIASVATWAAVLAAIIAGSANPDVILAALSIGQSVSYQRQVNFTRANEQEADRIGIRTLSEAGYDPQGMASFFHKLEQQTRLYGSGMPEFLRTHPVNTSRIAEAQARAASLPPARGRDSMEYGFMRSRMIVFAADQPSDAVDSFSALMAAGQDTPAQRYGLAFALKELGQNERALQVLQPTLEQYPRQANLALLKASIQMAAGETDAAMATYQKALAQNPRWSPAILEYSEALIHAGRPEEARRILLGHEQSFGTRLDTYRLLSQAAFELKNNAEASYQMATYLFERGDSGGALSQLDAGLRLAGLSAQDRARLSARRAEVRETLPRFYREDRPEPTESRRR